MRRLFRGRRLGLVVLGVLGLVFLASLSEDDAPTPAAPSALEPPRQAPNVVESEGVVPQASERSREQDTRRAVAMIDDAQRLLRANRPTAARQRLMEVPRSARSNQRIARRIRNTAAAVRTTRIYIAARRAARQGDHAKAANRFASIAGFRDATARSRAERTTARAVAAAMAPAPAPPVAADCDPNYTGHCVPVYPPDVNCSDVPVTVTVVGDDPHGLDGDGDGRGCE